MGADFCEDKKFTTIIFWTGQKGRHLKKNARIIQEKSLITCSSLNTSSPSSLLSFGSHTQDPFCQERERGQGAETQTEEERRRLETLGRQPPPPPHTHTSPSHPSASYFFYTPQVSQHPTIRRKKNFFLPHWKEENPCKETPANQSVSHHDAEEDGPEVAGSGGV